MSVEEKIRRAEEIYYRRNGQNLYGYRQKESGKNAPTLTHRMLKQLIICLMIYGVFYVVNNRDYFMSQQFRNEVQEIASKNEQLNNLYNYVIGYIDKYFTQNDELQENQDKSEEVTTNVTTEENNQEKTSSQNEQELESNEENIGGAVETVNISEEKSQEEQDIDYVKNNISFITPIQGTITSTFGWRTPTTTTVPKYHTGLDIAASTGTVIKSATEGKVILASSQGDYGNHYKIEVNGIIIIYAHCSKLYLKEGDSVTQGQEIAEVGSTGNSTRSTPTF